jgi:acetyl esterase/lipase
MDHFAHLFRHPKVTYGLGLLAALVICFSVAIFTRTPIIPLWLDGAPNAKSDAAVDQPRISVYLPPDHLATGTGILICPGGGYGAVMDTFEGRDIAHWLNSIGIAAFVLNYRHGGNDYRHPIPFQDGQRAIRLIRSRAAAWDLHPERLGIMGFSAGGHLAAMVGTRFTPSRPGHTDSVDAFSSRPDFMVLVYPVITMVGPHIEPGSKQNLLGLDPPRSLAEDVSAQRLVTPATPPTFLVHTKDDPGVVVENSLLFHSALQKAGVTAALHIFERGGHGFGLGKGRGPVEQWSALCAIWLKAQGLLVEPGFF